MPFTIYMHPCSIFQPKTQLCRFFGCSSWGHLQTISESINCVYVCMRFRFLFLITFFLFLILIFISEPIKHRVFRFNCVATVTTNFYPLYDLFFRFWLLEANEFVATESYANSFYRQKIVVENGHHFQPEWRHKFHGECSQTGTTIFASFGRASQSKSDFRLWSLLHTTYIYMIFYENVRIVSFIWEFIAVIFLGFHFTDI